MKEFVYHRLLLPSVSRNADRPCATNAATGFSTTYAEHLDRVSRLIGGLVGLGLERTDRFAVMALNSPEYLELYHAGLLGVALFRRRDARPPNVVCKANTTHGRPFLH
jgi:acyl-CoA synthetase (AMP-forming)/AMP-acid ligase II